MAMVSGGLIYVIGMFAVTMFFNVPLNDVLMAAGLASSEVKPLWEHDLADWTWRNHVRIGHFDDCLRPLHRRDRGEVTGYCEVSKPTKPIKGD